MPELVEARVASTSQHYADGIERVTLDVRLGEAAGLPIPAKGEEQPIDLVLDSTSYAANLRVAGSYVYVCADLSDAGGEKVRLADVLFEHGLTTGQRVQLRVDGSRVHVLRAQG